MSAVRYGFESWYVEGGVEEHVTADAPGRVGFLWPVYSGPDYETARSISEWWEKRHGVPLRIRRFPRSAEAFRAVNHAEWEVEHKDLLLQIADVIPRLDPDSGRERGRTTPIRSSGNHGYIRRKSQASDD